LGIVFRSVRVAIGGVCYFSLRSAFAIAYVIWLAIPAIIIFYVAKNI